MRSPVCRRRGDRWCSWRSCCSMSGAVLGPAGTLGPPDPRTYRPPVTAPVTDPFRPPAQPWRRQPRAGVRHRPRDAGSGDRRRASWPSPGRSPGRSTSPCCHPDGLRSTYSYLAVVLATVGERVEAGQVVGIAAERLHLGVRRGETYLDPRRCGARRHGGRVALVPSRTRLGGFAGGPDIGPGPGTRPGSGSAAPGQDSAVASSRGRTVVRLGRSWQPHRPRSPIWRPEVAGLVSVAGTASLASSVGPPTGGPMSLSARSSPVVLQSRRRNGSGIRSTEGEDPWRSPSSP